MTRWSGERIAVTARLELRTFRREDLPDFAALNSDPLVYAWLGGRPVPREESDAIAAWAQDLYDAEGIGLLAVERREDGAFLGMCGLHHQESYPDDVEVAWRLGMTFDHAAEVTDEGETFDAVVHVLSAGVWRRRDELHRES